MFFGSYQHQIDDRGRLRVPTPFKDELGQEFCLVGGADNSIKLYPRQVIEEQYKELRAKTNPMNAEDQKRLKVYFSRVFNVSLDKQGRLAIPANLLSYAGLSKVKDVTSTGLGDHVCVTKCEEYLDSEYAEALEYLSRK